MRYFLLLLVIQISRGEMEWCRGVGDFVQVFGGELSLADVTSLTYAVSTTGTVLAIGGHANFLGTTPAAFVYTYDTTLCHV